MPETSGPLTEGPLAEGPLAEGPLPRPALPWRIAAATVVAVPALCLAVGVISLVSRGISALELSLLAVLYVITGLGITVGFHRGFTHRAFAPNRAVKIGLAVAGTLAGEGALDEWVAAHRLHHARSDQPGDPHSPWQRRDGGPGGWRGLWWSHAGWLAHGSGVTDTDELAGDITGDRDLAFICRHTFAITMAGVLVPFALGVLIGGSLSAGLWCALWAAGVRICLLHHVTWAINSVCHLTGARPFRSKDRSGNVAWLALASFGESWHNAHHTWPNLARHGLARGQLDLSAEVIRVLERAGWVSKVRWPSARVHETVAAAGHASRQRVPTVAAASAGPQTLANVDAVTNVTDLVDADHDDDDAGLIYAHDAPARSPRERRTA